MVQKRVKKDTLDRLNLHLLAVSLVALAVVILSVVISRLMSNDVCLRDWDYECTVAPGYVQAIADIYFPAVLLFYGFFFATSAVTFLNVISKLFSRVNRGRK